MEKVFLFVYGTLLSQDHEFAVYLKNNSRFYSPGKVKGRLYDIGEYPGAVLSAEGDDYIYGSILEIDRPEIVLPVIDDYEGYGNKFSWPYEFVRKLTDIETESGIIRCDIYLYNLPVSGLMQITGGKYIQ